MLMPPLVDVDLDVLDLLDLLDAVKLRSARERRSCISVLTYHSKIVLYQAL